MEINYFPFHDVDWPGILERDILDVMMITVFRSKYVYIILYRIYKV